MLGPSHRTTGGLNESVKCPQTQKAHPLFHGLYQVHKLISFGLNNTDLDFKCLAFFKMSYHQNGRLHLHIFTSL